MLAAIDARNAAAAATHPEGSIVTTTVHSIGGRSELVAGTVTGHKRGQLVVKTDCHGTILVPLNQVER